MYPHELELEYPLGERLPAPAELVDVAPGVRWLRMPLPFALDHIHLWLLRDRFDPGSGAARPDGPRPGGPASAARPAGQSPGANTPRG